MKSKVIVMKNIKIKIILFISIIFFVISLININSTKPTEKLSNFTLETSNNLHEKENKEEIKTVSRSKIKQAYVNIPEKINGHTVIGKIEIPKIELKTYVLKDTSGDTLKETVTKLCGPNINGVGNFCIIGHNYNASKMFKKLKNLEISDRVFLSDIYDQIIEYEVYDKYKVYPKETKCLSQETNGEREITLITCTTGGIKRLIIKAREVYD